MNAQMHSPDRRQLRAEAAAWLARLRSDNRSSQDQAAFEAWAATDAAHRKAFEEVTATFEAAGAAPIRALRPQWRAREALTRRRVLAGGLTAAGAVGVGVLLLRPDATYATAIGEQRRVILPDRTVVEMDTNTRLSVRFDAGRRAVSLERGRAAFTVAADPERPFLVTVADCNVIADDARFDVSRLDGETTVLSETGAVSVRRGAAGPPAERLQAGSRLRYEGADRRLDTVRDVAAATAWRDGRLQFDGETLAEAVRQMNRYSTVPLVVEDRTLAAHPIAGVYRTGDALAFAESAALLVGGRVRPEAARVVLEPAA